MPSTTKDAVQIEPLTTKEQKERGGTSSSYDPADDPNFPEKWKKKSTQIKKLIEGGYKYYKRKIRGKMFMILRKGKKDKSLGVWTEEKEGKLFHFYPMLEAIGGIPRPPPWSPDAGAPAGTGQGRSFLSIPINRVAIIPRDYIPSINVIRYFQIMRENGFPGDFSQFINDIVVYHMRHCHGIVLPIVLEEEIEYRSEGEENAKTVTA